MGTVWFKNPASYSQQLVDADARPRMFWERSVLEKLRIEPKAFADVTCRNLGYEYMIEESFGVTHFKEGSGQIATYPIWNYVKDKMAILEEMCEGYAAADLNKIAALPRGERPSLGQQHLICVQDIPGANINVGREFYKILETYMNDYDVEFLIPNITSFRIAFGFKFAHVAMDPQSAAVNNSLFLPSGKQINSAEIVRYPAWSRIFGHTPTQLSGSSAIARIEYNIASMLFAEQNWDKLTNFKQKTSVTDITSPVATLPTGSTVNPLATKPKNLLSGFGDKVQCDTCSLAGSCTYARSGSVCSVPDSDGVSLASYFQTRDTDKIIDGLMRVTSNQAARLERKAAEEESFGDDDGKLSPQINAISAQVFAQGKTLAQLLDPALRSGGTKVQVNVGGGGNTAISMGASDPREIMANVVRELEAQGISRENQTPKMIQGYLEKMGVERGPQHKSKPIKPIKQLAIDEYTIDAAESF